MTPSTRPTSAALLAGALLLLLANRPADAQSGAVLEAQNGIGRTDPTPAATLLLPYFEVDPNNQPGGITTMLSIHNATPAPVLAHLTLWTDWSVPTIDWDVYLTGFDVQVLDLGVIFTSGLIEPTGPVHSNQGDLSLPNTAPASCSGQLPVGNLFPILIDLIHQAHTGQPVDPIFGGDCWGHDHGDGIARGFATIDVGQQCSTLFPSSPGYFGAGGVASDDEALWGDWLLADPAAGRVFGQSLVHLESDPDLFQPGGPTFYGRHVGFAATDGREPLATSWAAAFQNGPSAATDLIVWRDPQAGPQSVVCGTQPPPAFPLPAGRVIAFDEEENPEEPGAALTAFPLATQRVPVGQSSLPVTAAAGWMYLDLDVSSSTGAPAPGQSWVGLLVEGANGLSLAREGTPLDNALRPRPLDTVVIFEDGFESGDLSAWDPPPPPGSPSDAELAARSGIGRMDATPAATLLLPYFEVDVDSQPGGRTTVVSLRNAAAAPALARVTIWTDWSIPTVAFDVYLTGFDVQALDLSDLFTTGALPQTSPQLSNRGDLSLPNAEPPGCAGNLPTGNLPPSIVELIRDAHRGQAVDGPSEPGDECWGEDHGDGLARGYLTVDLVDECSTVLPNSPGYFGPAGIAGSANRLWGDWILDDPAAGTAVGASLVHLEAEPDLFESGDYSFYGRLVGFDASDGREPLPTSWTTRYLDGGSFAGASSLVVWRDPKTDPEPVICGGRPAPFPLAAARVIAFDEEENPEEPGAALAAFPLATQRVPVGQAAFPVSAPFGWAYLDLNHIAGDPLQDAAQSWVTLLVDAPAGLDFGNHGVPLDSALLPFSLPTARIPSEPEAGATSPPAP